MLNKLLQWFGPGLLKKLASPGQLASVARTLLKFVGGYLAGAGFSDKVIASFIAANEQVVAGLLSLVVGVVFSFFAEKKKKEE